MNKSNQDQLHFQTSYGLSYSYNVRPQDFTRNDLYGDTKSIDQMKDSQVRIVEMEERTQRLKEQESSVQKFHKKGMDFTKTFDKPHNNIGLRN